MCFNKERSREKEVYLKGREMLRKDTDPFEVAKNVKLIMTLFKSMGLLDEERILRMRHTNDSLITTDENSYPDDPKMLKALPLAVNHKIDQNINNMII